MRQFLTIQLLVVLIFGFMLVPPLAHAQTDPVLEISFGDRQTFSVEVADAASPKRSMRRSVKDAAKIKRHPFAVSPFVLPFLSDDGDRIVLQHGFQNRHCLFLEAETSFSELWHLAGEGKISPTGQEVLLSHDGGMDLVDAAGAKTNLETAGKKDRNYSLPAACFGKSGKLYVVWSGESKTVDKARFIHKGGPRTLIRQLMVSNDESKLVANNFVGSRVFGKAMLCSAESGEIITERKFSDDHPLYAEFSPKGDQCVISTPKQNLLVELPSLETKRDFKEGGPAGFTKDGSAVWVTDGYRHFSRFPAEANGQSIEKVKITAFSSDCLYDHSLGGNQHSDKKIKVDSVNGLIYRIGGKNSYSIIDIDSGEQVGRLPKNSTLVDGVNQRVYCQERGIGKIDVYDFDDNLNETFGVSRGELVAVSPDGSEFLYRGQGKLVPNTSRYEAAIGVYDSRTGKKKRELGTYNIRMKTQFSPDGKIIVFRPGYGMLHNKHEQVPSIILVDFATGKEIGRIDNAPWFCTHVEFSRDSKRVLICGSINIESWKRLGWVPLGEAEAREEFNKIAGDWPALNIWDLQNASLSREVRGLSQSIHRECVLSEDGSKLLVADRSNGPDSIRILDTQSGDQVAYVEGSIPAANGDLSKVILRHIKRKKTKNQRLELWDMVAVKKICEFWPFDEADKEKTHGFWIQVLDWTKQKFLAGGFKGRLIIFDLNADGSLNVSAETRREIPGAIIGVRPKKGNRGSQLVSVHHRDSSVRFLDAQSLQELGRIYLFEDKTWVAIRSDGHFTGSEGVGQRLKWRENNQPTVSGSVAIRKFSDDNLIFAGE